MEINDEYIISKFWPNKISILKRKLNANLVTEEEKNYLENRYGDSFSLAESLYRIKYNIDEVPRCPVCGKKIKYSDTRKRYARYCNKSCMTKDIKNINARKKGTYDKYGCYCTMQLKDTIRKSKETWTYKSKGEILAIKERAKETSMEKNGIDNWCGQKKNAEHWKNKTKEEIEEITNKKRKTCLEHYGVDNYSKTKEWKEHASSISSIVQEKIYQTMKRNNSWNCVSKQETQFIDRLRKIYGNVLTQYKSVRYPWKADAYIPSEDVWIEFNFHWTHGGHEYNPNSDMDNAIINEWKSKNTQYYNNAIETWTKKDKEKLEFARKNKLKYIVLWNVEEAETLLKDISINFNDDILKEEYNKIIKSNSSLSIVSRYNKIIYQFLGKIILKEPFKLYEDIYERYKLLRNREKYLGKKMSLLTDMEKLKGFQISMRCQGYSMFNPSIIKYFIDKYNLSGSICYDPCGGWGQRMLGSSYMLKKYIYNDLSTNTYNGINNIVNYLELKNVDTYNNDANTFIPDDDYDFMFTCPPYYAEGKNIEVYECKDFSSQNEYDEFIRNLYNKFIIKDSCKYFGLILRDDMIPNDLNNKVYEKIPLRNSNSHITFYHKKRHGESIFVFKK